MASSKNAKSSVFVFIYVSKQTGSEIMRYSVALLLKAQCNNHSLRFIFTLTCSILAVWYVGIASCEHCNIQEEVSLTQTNF